MIRHIALATIILVSVVSPLTAQTTASYQQGMQAIENENYAAARGLLIKALDEGADPEMTWYALGFVAQSMADFDLMVQAGKHLTKLQPSRSDGWYMMSVGYYQKGAMDSLVMPTQRLMILDPKLARESKLDKLLKRLSQDEAGVKDSVFTSDDRFMKVALPASWHARTEDQGKTKNWFVTLEEITQEEDLFTVGATFRWTRDLVNTIPELKGNTGVTFMVDFWREYIKELGGGKEPFEYAVLDSASFRIGKWKGDRMIVRMKSYEGAYELIKYDIVLTFAGNIFTIIMECPSDLWPVYRTRFDKAIESIKL